MTSILIRDLPEDTHKALLRRAQARGQSLQQYLTVELTRLAASPTLEEVLRRIDARQGGRVGFAQAVAALDDDRSRR